MKTSVITYGCQMNEYDTHLVKSELASVGAEFTEDWQDADFVLLNTCAVRGKPVEKVKTMLGELKKIKKERNLMIGMMGCLAQLEEGQKIAKRFDVDILLGPGALTEIGKAVESKSKFWDLSFRSELTTHTPPAPKGALQAFTSIIRGCNHHCTYCIVPTTRGPEVSRNPDDILNEIRSLRGAGVQEVTLLGQNVNSYGNDQSGYPKFGELLRKVGEIGIPRIKFTTSHPVNFTDEVIAGIAATPQVCDFIHLPVQSGSNRVLRLMAREYRREWYLDRIRAIKEALPNVVLCTDIIVGFPGETEEDFQETLSLYDEVGYDMAYMFIYSPRAGTPSFKHFEDLPREVKVERLQRLIEKQKEWSLKQFARQQGKTLEVLIRGAGRDEQYAEGHSRGNHPVLVPAAQAPTPGIYQVVIKQTTPHMLMGEVVGSSAPMTIPLMMA